MGDYRPVLPYGPPTADILIVGEAPGENEEKWGQEYGKKYGQPFVGASGWHLTQMLAEVGIDRGTCLITNVCLVRPEKNDISTFFSSKPSPDFFPFNNMYVSREILLGCAYLEHTIRTCKPRVIIACGATPLWALGTDGSPRINYTSKGKKRSSPGGILLWRGSNLEYKGIPLIPTIHPAAMLRQWGWRGVIVRDLQRAKSAMMRKPVPPARIYHIQPTFGEVMTTLYALRKECDEGPTLLSVDIETEHRRMDCVGISWSALEGICIPFIKERDPYWPPHEELEIRWALRELLSHPNAKVIGHNFTYDAQYLFHELAYFPTCAHDTMIQHHVLQADLKNALYFVCSLYCSWYVYWKDDLKEFREAQRGQEKEDPLQYWKYNLEDCFYTFEVNTIQCKLLERTGLQPQADEQMSWWPMVLWTSLKGCAHDMEAQEQAKGVVLAHMILLEVAFISLVGQHVGEGKGKRSAWYTSPVQKANLFYKEMGQKRVVSRTAVDKESGSTNADALAEIAQREPRLRLLCEMLIEHGHLSSLLTKALNASVSPDGRLRTTFNLAGPRTYRLSSRENSFGEGTNLQNLPSKL